MIVTFGTASASVDCAALCSAAPIKDSAQNVEIVHFTVRPPSVTLTSECRHRTLHDRTFVGGTWRQTVDGSLMVGGHHTGIEVQLPGVVKTKHMPELMRRYE